MLGKMESLQPIGGYKLRGTCNNIKALLEVEGERLRTEGVTTSSSGNWACGVAFMCAKFDLKCTICVPDNAPPAKLERVREIYPAVNIVPLPWEKYWNVVLTRQYPPGAQQIHPSPVVDHATMAGNGTLGLEILRETPDCDAILVPYGGGALSTGIAIAAKALKPEIKVFACEVETAAPFSAALANGAPKDIDNSGRAFIDGIGNSGLMAEIWPISRDVLDGTLVVTVAEAAEACRRMAVESKLVIEGASGCGVAAARKYGPQYRWKKPVCVVTGGNIDPGVFTEIIHGGVPTSTTSQNKSKM